MDRAYGGVSLILHVEGANRPNSPLRPEFVKADVYFPGYLFYEDTRFPPIISRMTQQFITDIGLPVIERWERCTGIKSSYPQHSGKNPPQPHREQDASEWQATTPNGSSTFVIHGHKVVADTTDEAASQREVGFDDEDGCYVAFDPSPAELQIIDALEKNAYLDNEVKSIRQELCETKKALSDALARECTLNAQLDAAMGQLSGTDNGASGSQPRHQLPFTRQPFPYPQASPSSPSRRIPTYTSPLRGAVTPRKLTSFNPATPATPANHSGSLHLQKSPLFGTTSHFQGGARATESFADYHDFLDYYNMSHLTSPLEYIRNNIPIFSWSNHMEQLNISSDKIPTLVSLLLKAVSSP